MVALMDGFDGWRRWWLRMVASMVDVDGGLGSSTQRALTWKSLCVPSGEGDTHSGCLLFVSSVCRITVACVFVSRSRFVTVCCVSCSTVWASYLCLLFQSSVSFFIVVYTMRVTLTAELWCL